MTRFLVFLSALAVLLVWSSAAAHSQAPALAPVSVGATMPDFTLPAYQGGSVTLSSFKGKTVVLIFPRGYAAAGAWCHVCNYQYSELVEYDVRTGFRAKKQVEILFVLPYAREAIADWIDKYPQQLADLEAWKNPSDPSKLDEAGKARMERARRVYPKVFKATSGQVPLPFPILVDSDRAVSKGLGLFTEAWSGSKAEQNVPTVFVIDPSGVVQFKYLSQNTIDRPGVDHLAKVVDWVKASAVQPPKGR